LKFEKLDGFNSYYDEEDQPLEFCSDRKTIHYNEVKIVLNKLPYLKNSITDVIYFTTAAVVIINDHISVAKSKGESTVTINQLGRFNRGKLPIGKGTKFQYSSAEHFFIPGLIIDFPSNGYLTPVYFNHNVLVKYQHGAGYNVSLTTESFGLVSISGGASFHYGINKSGNVIMWLGDLVKLDERELLYLYSENIAPQYDLHSDFYDNQILNKWL